MKIAHGCTVEGARRWQGISPADLWASPAAPYSVTAQEGTPGAPIQTTPHGPCSISRIDFAVMDQASFTVLLHAVLSDGAPFVMIAIEACVARDAYGRSAVPGVTYFSFVDPAGGSGQDIMILSICPRSAAIPIEIHIIA